MKAEGRIDVERLIDAAKQARKEGLSATTEWQRVRKELQSWVTLGAAGRRRSDVH